MRVYFKVPYLADAYERIGEPELEPGHFRLGSLNA